MSISSNITAQLRALYEARHEPENLRPLAEAYWRMLLSLAALSIVLVLVYGIWVFVGVIQNLSSAGGGLKTAPQTSLDRKQLAGTLQAFDARRSQFESVKLIYEPPADPAK